MLKHLKLALTKITQFFDLYNYIKFDYGNDWVKVIYDGKYD
jgi:hypothetical protein